VLWLFLQVRIQAAEALANVCTAAIVGSVQAETVGKVAEVLVMHMCDANVHMREAACRALQALASQRPCVVHAEMVKAQGLLQQHHPSQAVIAHVMTSICAQLGCTHACFLDLIKS
jgi:hypothetical protein